VPSPTITVDATGLHVPSYEQLKTYLEDAHRAIYGGDIILTPDSQDGQLIAIYALAYNDAYAALVSVFNAFSPSSAQGANLSRLVKLNGLRRKVPTYSTVDLRVVGQVGTVITNGVAIDDEGRRWLLPATVSIPDPAGEIMVTATAEDVGAVFAPAMTITNIATPTRGWQTVSNPTDATPGAPVESDADLRRRQTIATTRPSRGLLEGLLGEVAAVSGVGKLFAYENAEDVTDQWGVPPHAVALVVQGGDADEIAAIILAKKGPGVRTYGTTQITVTDAFGVPRIISFFRPVSVPIKVVMQIVPGLGYSDDTGDAIRQAVIDFGNSLAIGETVERFRVAAAATLMGSGRADVDTFKILSFAINRIGLPVFEDDVPLAFNELSEWDVSNISIQVLRS
jgi:uncharacterized phage protein gp47/JayE